MTVQYVAYTWSGRKVQGVLETESVASAYDELARDDLIPYRVEQVQPPRPMVERFPALFKPKIGDLVDLSRQIASLLKSGVALRRTLMTLQTESRSPGLRFALAKILEDVESGVRLSDALEKHPTVFPPFYTRLVRIAEATGSLVFTFERLAETLEQRKDTQDKVRSALMYPMISLVIAMVAGVVLVLFALPALTELLTEFGGELPFTTKVLQGLSTFLQSYILHIVGAIAGISAMLLLYTRTSSGALMRDGLLLKAPVIGGVIIRSTMQSFTSTLRTLINEGVPLVEALRLSGDAVSNLVVLNALENATADATAGSSLGQAFRRQTVFPPLLTQGIVTGELSGTLPETLEGLSEYYRKESQRSVTTATELIQPAIILVVGGVVGFVAVAVVSGIYSTIGQVQP